MKLWSRGLGKRVLFLDLGEGEVENQGSELAIKGVIKDPVWWEYTIWMTEKDVLDFFQIAVNRTAVGYLIARRQPGRLFLWVTLKLVKMLFLWIVLWLRKPFQKVPNELPAEELVESR